MTNVENGEMVRDANHLNTAVIFFQSFFLIPIFYKAVSCSNAYVILFFSDEPSQGFSHIAS